MFESTDTQELSVNKKWLVIPETNRSGMWKVEIPDILKDTKFPKLTLELIPKVLEEVHPFVRRASTIVHFPPEIIRTKEYTTGESIMGTGGLTASITKNKKFYIAFSMKELENWKSKDPTTIAVYAIWRILHEIFEIDYWQKSKFLKEKPKRLKFNDPNYQRAEHEIVAHRKASVFLQKNIGAKMVFSDKEDDPEINIVVSEPWLDA